MTSTSSEWLTVLSSIRESLPGLWETIRITLIAPLLAAAYGLLSEPLQRRSRKGNLDYLEKKISVGKQLLDPGSNFSLSRPEQIRVKRELVAASRLYQAHLKERSLQRMRDRRVIYLRPSSIKLVPPWPSTPFLWAGTLYYLWILGIYLGCSALFALFLVKELVCRAGVHRIFMFLGACSADPESIPVAVTLFVLGFVYILLWGCWCEVNLFWIVRDAQRHVIRRRKLSVPSLNAIPITFRSWVSTRWWIRRPLP
jgi:hypothetical protein